MSGFMGREAPDIRAELAAAPEPELTPEAHDGGDGGYDPAADPKPAPAAQPVAKAEPAPDPDDVDVAVDGKALPPDEARKIALRRERQRAKELETQLSAERETKARMEERFQLFQEALAQQQAQYTRAQEPGDAEPDRSADPLAHHEWQIRQLAQRTEAAERQLQMTNAQQQEMARFNAVRAAYAAKAQEYMQTAPDWKAAYDHVAQARYNDMIFAGYSPQIAQQTIMREEQMAVTQWLNAGVNPAAKIYEYAQQRGYKPPSAEPAAQPGAEAVKLQQAKGAAAASLSAQGGAPTTNGLSLEDLARLPPDEFAKATSGDGWLRMVGGRASRKFGAGR